MHNVHVHVKRFNKSGIIFNGRRRVTIDLLNRDVGEHQFVLDVSLVLDVHHIAIHCSQFVPDASANVHAILLVESIGHQLQVHDSFFEKLSHPINLFIYIWTRDIRKTIGPVYHIIKYIYRSVG